MPIIGSTVLCTGLLPSDLAYCEKSEKPLNFQVIDFWTKRYQNRLALNQYAWFYAWHRSTPIWYGAIPLSTGDESTGGYPSPSPPPLV